MGPREALESYLSAQDIAFERAGESSWALQLRGERKHSIPVVVTAAERTLSIQSFFIRRPLDDAAEFYRMLLARNLRPSTMRFAADAEGDVYLVGEMPLDAVEERSLDALFGELLYTCDQMFDAAIAVGFRSYVERDRAWRAAQTPSAGDA